MTHGGGEAIAGKSNMVIVAPAIDGAPTKEAHPWAATV